MVKSTTQAHGPISQAWELQVNDILHPPMGSITGGADSLSQNNNTLNPEHQASEVSVIGLELPGYGGTEGEPPGWQISDIRHRTLTP